MKFEEVLARNAGFDAPTCHVSSRWLLWCRRSVLWGKLQNPSLLNVSKQAVMSFCVAGVALRGIPTCFETRQKSSLWQAQYCCDVSRRCVEFFVAGAAL